MLSLAANLRVCTSKSTFQNSTFNAIQKSDLLILSILHFYSTSHGGNLDVLAADRLNCFGRFSENEEN